METTTKYYGLTFHNHTTGDMRYFSANGHDPDGTEWHLNPVEIALLVVPAVVEAIENQHEFKVIHRQG